MAMAALFIRPAIWLIDAGNGYRSTRFLPVDYTSLGATGTVTANGTGADDTLVARWVPTAAI